MSMLGRMFGLGFNAAYDRGIRLYDQGMYEEAISAFEEAKRPENEPDALTQRLASFYAVESHVNLGAAALQRGDFPQARQEFRQALAINPQFADLHFQMGRACQLDGDASAAQASFQQALAINPRYARARYYYGLSLYETGSADEAMVEVQAAAQLDPAYGTPLLEEARAAQAAGEIGQARALLAQQAEGKSDEVIFHSRLGADLYRRGLYVQAAQEFRQALAGNPGYADVRNHLAIALNAQGLYEEAIEELQKALAINPGYVEARNNLALTLRAAGRDAEAAAEFQKVLDDDPNNSIACGQLAAGHL